jgi:hypothetical protein
MTNPAGTLARAGHQFRPAYLQSAVPLDKLLHSANAGFLVHRSGLLRYEFRAEGLQFAGELVELINAAQAGTVSVFLYEELFGVHNRLHWVLHMRHPNDYGRLLDMVDHDKKWREVADLNRLPAKGGGGWERMFVEGSIQETVICPQHGLGYGDHEAADTFQPPASFQTTLPADELLHSANSALTVHRVAQAGYAVREEARLFAYEWAGYVNTALAGRATAFLYEEMWGRQDRLHTLIHLDSLDAYQELLALEEGDEGLHDLLARQWIPVFKGGGTWERLFIDGTIADTLWVPRQKAGARP